MCIEMLMFFAGEQSYRDWELGAVARISPSPPFGCTIRGFSWLG